MKTLIDETPGLSPLCLGPEHGLIMALIVQPDTKDASQIGFGPFAALGCMEGR